MKKTLFILALVLFFGCESSSPGLQKFNSQDSLQVIDIFNCYLDNEHPYFSSLSKDRSKILDIHLEYVLYNPDSTKIVAITLLESKVKNMNCRDNDSSTFVFYPFVGYRKSSNSKWKLCFYRNPLLLDGCNRGYMREIIREKFIENIKRQRIYKYTNKEYSYELVNCSINEECFWDSPFWEKGRLIDDKYNFEIRTKNLMLGDF